MVIFQERKRMDGYTFVCNVTDLSVGSMRTYTLMGRRVAVANVDSEFFAIDDMCSHEQCSLGSDGALDGNVVICGCHGGQFDVTTGQVLAPPAPTDVASYTVQVKDGGVYIKL